ncbi:hypothetical protein LOK49_LG04G02452 [Camellia lanceoleosa]|uniref:Uncharacterized protein n=1 Tax=Camellia lanceoleosa TaxID=1840588 RepID=A0ACC0HYB2_9ERIC|nr:hypothetical protein LOK49_LG04G02452 [Camellia lanceoleosa]
MLRNPRCCVTHPDIFQQPWAIVSPTPTSYRAKILRRAHGHHQASKALPQKHPSFSGFSTSPNRPNRLNQPGRNEGGESDGKGFNCWLFGKSKRKKVWKRDGKCDDDDDDDNDGNCFDCLIGVIKIKDNTKNNNEETRSTSSSVNGVSSETVGLNRRRIGGGFVKRRKSCDNWQPSLQSVIED